MFSPEIRLVFLILLSFVAAGSSWLATQALDQIATTKSSHLVQAQRAFVIKCLTYIKWLGVFTLVCHIILLGSLLRLYPFGK